MTNHKVEISLHPQLIGRDDQQSECLSSLAIKLLILIGLDDQFFLRIINVRRLIKNSTIAIEKIQLSFLPSETSTDIYFVRINARGGPLLSAEYFRN